jgi:hypothetical protein
LLVVVAVAELTMAVPWVLAVVVLVVLGQT